MISNGTQIVKLRDRTHFHLVFVWKTRQPPGTTSAPTVQFGPVAPNVTLTQCREDLIAADEDLDQRITEQEFVTFLETFGERVCYERDAGAVLNDLESDNFDALIRLTPVDDAGVTDINIAESALTPTLAFTLCTFTYEFAMGATICDGTTGAEETTIAPTATPDETDSPITEAPVAARSGGVYNKKGSNWMMVTVVGAAVMFANFCM